MRDTDDMTPLEALGMFALAVLMVLGAIVLVHWMTR